MPKYKIYVNKMLEENKKFFGEFQVAHDKYEIDPDKNQEEFNFIGSKALVIINDYENRLCMQSEKGGYGKFTNSLAEKFQGEVRRIYPMIDSVGIIIKTSPKETPFVINRIKL